MAGGWTQAAEGRAARCFLKAEGAGGFRPESQANLAGPGPQKEAARRGIRAAGCGCVKPRSRSNKCCRITSRCAGLGQTGCGRCGWLWLACAAPLRRVENGAFLRACRHFNSPCPAPVLSSLTGKGQPQRHGAARAEVAASSPVAGRLGGWARSTPTRGEESHFAPAQRCGPTGTRLIFGPEPGSRRTGFALTSSAARAPCQVVNGSNPAAVL